MAEESRVGLTLLPLLKISASSPLELSLLSSSCFRNVGVYESQEGLKMFELEAGQVEINGNVENTTGTSYTICTPSTPPTQAECVGSPKFDLTPSSSAMTRTVNADTQDSQEKDQKPSVSNCYVFKSRLQEYCQKAGLTTPTYETIREGPSHEPSFRSTVIVHDVRYDSLPGFFNRKAAEQSAAEVALIELANSADTKFGMAQHVHETGLCKNLLQEYAQKMNYAIPLYECHKEGKQGRTPMYSCTVEIGGIKYMGATTTTKKEAEIKAARTALLAIQSASSMSGDQAANSIYTVLPQKKKGSSTSDLGFSAQETAAALKTKKRRFKKPNRNKKKRFPRRGKSDANGDSGAHVPTAGGSDNHNAGGADCGVMETNTDAFSVGFDSGNVERGDDVEPCPPS